MYAVDYGCKYIMVAKHPPRTSSIHTTSPHAPDSWATWRATAERYNLQFDLHTFLAYAGTPARAILNDLCAKQGVQVDADEVLAWKHSHYLQHHVHKVKPIEPVVAILNAAKAKGWWLCWCASGCVGLSDTQDDPIIVPCFPPYLFYHTSSLHTHYTSNFHTQFHVFTHNTH